MSKKITLYTGNYLEVLLEKLAGILKHPLNSPFARETIVVQSKGMERWISMELAKTHGVCANYWFPFPNVFIHSIYEGVIPDIIARQRSDSLSATLFDRDKMTWKIMGILDSLINEEAFKSLRNYIGNSSASNLKKFQLSQRISGLFDQYILFRPEMISKWDNGEDDNWQAILWRQLTADQKIMHSAELGNKMLERILNGPVQMGALPQRFAIFGISTLPPFHLQLFFSMALVCEVNLFMLNPCRYEWSHIFSDLEIARMVKKDKKFSAEDLHLEQGNSLLASFGRSGREFFNFINYHFEDLPVNHEEKQFFKNPQKSLMLSLIQNEILNLEETGYEKEDKTIKEKTRIKNNDKSIEIHSCYSPMREIEILYDNLLMMFQEDENLKPGDIIVITPDIEKYAPYIKAVFNVRFEDDIKIPFSIADRSMRNESRVIDTFFAILELSESRFGAGQVLDLLDCRAVMKKFNILPGDLEIIYKWVEQTRIKWGIDSNNRKKNNLPETWENTWEAGIDRLLLGYAMLGNGEKIFENIIPYDEINDTDVLGSFINFLNTVFLLSKKIKNKHKLENWSEILLSVLENCFETDQDDEREFKYVREIIVRLMDIASSSEIIAANEKYGLDVILCYLKRKLDEQIHPFGFMTGNVTFCAMLPMRSIPFKVICMVGMNDRDYPRPVRQMSFDLIAQKPKIGDKSLRNEDKYIFLESIISARKKLYISYVGQNIKDTKEIPPSVLVSELKEYIEKSFYVKNKCQKDAPDFFVKHRLQAFHPDYFSQESKLFSFSKENYHAAKKLLKKDHLKETVKFPTIISNNNKQIIELNNFVSFFRNPSKYFLKNQLKIHLEDNRPDIQEKENFKMPGLEKYFLQDQLTQKGIMDLQAENFFEYVKAAGDLPHGNVGLLTYNNLSQEIKQFVKKIKPFLKDEIIEPLEIDLDINGYRLMGNINNIRLSGLVHYRFAKVKAFDYLRIWIYHLILNCFQENNFSKNSTLAAREGIWQISSINQSKKDLENLLNLYVQGQSSPIHFFPETSLIFYQRLDKGDPENKCISKAKANWYGNNFKTGELNDPYYHLCFKDIDPFDNNFISVSKKVFTPIFQHRSKIEF